MKHAQYLVPIVVLTTIVICTQLFAQNASKEMLLVMEYHFDKLQHFLAGSTCGIFGIWCLALCHSDKLITNDHRAVLISAIISALVIGVMWEVYEHTFPEVNGGTHSYTSLDTMLDILLDLTGGCVAWLFFRRRMAT